MPVSPLPPLGSQGFTDYWDNKYVFNYCQMAVTTSCVYNILWTSPRAVRCVWQRKLSIASYIFIVSRYAALCYNGLGMVQMISWGSLDQRIANTTCNVMLTAADACTVLTYLALALFAALRTYAIWDKDRRVFAIIFGLGLIYPLGYTYFSLNIVYHASESPVTGCDHVNTLPAWFNISADLNAEELFYILGLIANVIFEVVTLILTWTKTIPIVRRLRRTNMTSVRNMSYVLHRDGTLHFVAILCANGLPILEFAWTRVRFAPPATENFTSILVSKFILDLRKDFLTRNGDRDTLSSVSDLSDIQFAPETPAVSVRNPDA